MLEDGRISALQTTGFLISIVLATALLFVPSVTAAYAGRDAWLSILPAGTIGAGIGLMAARLALRFPGETMIQYAPRLLGTIPGKIIGFLYVFYFFWAAYVILAEFHFLMGTAYLPRTPAVVHMGVLMLLAVYLVTRGLEVYCRVNGLILPALVAAVLIIFFSSVKEIKLESFQPVLENGLPPVLLGTLPPGAWLAETAAVLMLVPYITRSERRDATRAVLLAVFLVAIILELILVAVIGQLSATRTEVLLFPTFNLVRSIRFETLPIFERQDPLFMVIWIAGMLVKMGAFFYAGLLSLGQWLNLATYRPLAMPMAVLITALALQGFPNVIYLARYASETVPLVLLFANGGLTGILYLAALLRSRKGKGPGL